MTVSLRLTLLTLFSHWRRHPIQLLTWLVGLLLATALWSGVQAINQQARDSYDRAASLLGDADLPVYEPASGQTMAQHVFGELRRAGREVVPVLEGRVRIGERSWTVLGIDPVTLSTATTNTNREVAVGLPALQGDQLTDFLTAPGQTLVATETLRTLVDAVDTSLRTASGRSLPPLTVAEGIPPGTLIMDIGLAQRVLGQPEQLSRLLILDDPTLPLPDGLSSRLRFVPAEAEQDLARLTDSFHLNLTALGLLSFLVGLFMVHGATGLAFEQRRRVLSQLRACGVAHQTLVIALVLEVVVLALLAGAAGLVVGYGLAALLLPDVAASLRGLYGAEVGSALTLSPRWWLLGLAMSLGGGLLASAHSLWLSARLSVLSLGQPQAWHEQQLKVLRWLGGLSLLLWSVALVLALWGQGLVMAFAMLVALLLGSALGLPVVLASILRWVEGRSRAPLAQWFWADARQQLSGLSLALMALLLALSANIGVGGMVESFRQTFTGWLDQRLAAEVYVTVPEDQSAAEIEHWLQARPSVSAVLPTSQVTTMLDGWPLEINAVTGHATYRDYWPVLRSTADAWVELEAGQGVMVSEQLARRYNLSLGDSLVLPDLPAERGLTVGGIYSDYGNTSGQVLVAFDWVEAHYQERIQRRGFSVRIDPVDAPDLVDALRTSFGLSDSAVIDQARVKALAGQVFDRTFIATGALNLLTLGIAATALFTSLLALGDRRLAQLAPVWAMGVGRRQLGRLEQVRTLALALFTGLLAVPLGLVLAWCLVAVVNVEAFGWRLPLHFFPGQWLTLLGLALLAAWLAALIPQWQLQRRSAAAWTRVFAHE